MVTLLDPVVLELQYRQTRNNVIIIMIMFILSPKIPESSVDFTHGLRIQHT